MSEKMKLEQAKVGMHVIYVPNHAHGDRLHPDCEHGVVTSKNDTYVFVKFKQWHEHGQACNPEDLQ
mgnify:CR=1 FL=1